MAVEARWVVSTEHADTRADECATPSSTGSTDGSPGGTVGSAGGAGVTAIAAITSASGCIAASGCASSCAVFTNRWQNCRRDSCRLVGSFPENPPTIASERWPSRRWHTRRTASAVNTSCSAIERPCSMHTGATRPASCRACSIDRKPFSDCAEVLVHMFMRVLSSSWTSGDPLSPWGTAPSRGATSRQLPNKATFSTVTMALVTFASSSDIF
mmetsp:Transcript_12981/g.31286  ORF Transcript_12981/g.31286 Transcript_12981/m.31286 type:complete len:213 (+) Transcript_12981:563-1201(+)